jgi:hypothetical protein
MYKHYELRSRATSDWIASSMADRREFDINYFDVEVHTSFRYFCKPTQAQNAASLAGNKAQIFQTLDGQ